MSLATGIKASVLAPILGAVLLMANAQPAAAADPADGRWLYHGVVPFSVGAARLPAPFSACARCHGGNGEGGHEGSMIVPPLTWAALTEPRNGRSGFKDDDAVLRAIERGEGRDGATLNAIMPRFGLVDSEAIALLSFLHRVGTLDDQPTGVSRQDIVLGTLLPLSGPTNSAGRAILDGLNDSFDAVNRDGGVFGRRLTLHAVDTTNGAEQAARALLAQPVFAVVGGLWLRGGDVDRMFAERRISMLAPLMPSNTPASADGWAVELLPSRTAQQAALATAIRSCPASGKRWALRLAPDDDTGRSDAIRWFDDPDRLRTALREAPPTGCVGLDLAAGSTFRADIPALWQQRVVLPIPGALLRSDGSDAGSWRRLGRVAGQFAVELLSREGAQLHERSPIEAAAQLGDFTPLHLARTRSEGGVFRGWDAEVIAVPPTDPGGTQLREFGAQGG